MLSFKDYMEKYHSGYYDEYIKYTEDNKEREREYISIRLSNSNEWSKNKHYWSILNFRSFYYVQDGSRWREYPPPYDGDGNYRIYISNQQRNSQSNIDDYFLIPVTVWDRSYDTNTSKFIISKSDQNEKFLIRSINGAWPTYFVPSFRTIIDYKE